MATRLEMQRTEDGRTSVITWATFLKHVPGVRGKFTGAVFIMVSDKV